MSTTNTIIEIPLTELHDSPTNPREVFNDSSLQELAADIKSIGRVLQPLLVRPRIPVLFAGDTSAATGYEIVFGHRRKRGAELAELRTAPCMVRSMTDLEVQRAQLSENLQREDVHPFEEAAGFQALIDNHNETADRIAEQTGKSRSYVYGRLKLLAACPEVRKACLAGEIGAEVALLISRLHTPVMQRKALKLIEGKQLSTSDGGQRSYRQIRELLAEHFTLALSAAVFDTEAEMLVPAAGNCMRCTKRTGNAPEYTDLAAPERPNPWGSRYPAKGSADTCTDPDCFAAKKAAHLANQAAELRSKGKTVVDGNKARAAVDARGVLKTHYVPIADARKQFAARTGPDRHIGPLPVVSIQDPRTGKIIEAVAAADLKAAGVEPAATAAPRNHNSSDVYAQRQAERAALAERTNTLRNAVRAASLRAIGHRTLDEARAVALGMLSRISRYFHADSATLLEALWAQWGVAEDATADVCDDASTTGPGSWADAIASMDADTVAQLMIDITIFTPGNGSEESLTPLHTLARLHGIDPTAAPTPTPAARAQEGGGGEAEAAGSAALAPAEADDKGLNPAGSAGGLNTQCPGSAGADQSVDAGSAGSTHATDDDAGEDLVDQDEEAAA